MTLEVELVPLLDYKYTADLKSLFSDEELVKYVGGNKKKTKEWITESRKNWDRLYNGEMNKIESFRWIILEKNESKKMVGYLRWSKVGEEFVLRIVLKPEANGNGEKLSMESGKFIRSFFPTTPLIGEVNVANKHALDKISKWNVFREEHPVQREYGKVYKFYLNI